MFRKRYVLYHIGASLSIAYLKKIEYMVLLLFRCLTRRRLHQMNKKVKKYTKYIKIKSFYLKTKMLIYDKI